MEKRGISTGALVAIVVGVIVVAVFVYLVFFYGKESNLDCSLCKSKFTFWCSECNFTTPNPWGEVEMSDDLIECIQECLGIPPPPNNNDCKSRKNQCKTYIPGLFIPD